MKIFNLAECSDCDVQYGLLMIENDDTTEEEVQEKIYEFKNSYKAFGYSSLEEMKEDGYETIEDLIDNEIPTWDIEKLVNEAFPEIWNACLYEVDGTVVC